MLPDWDEGDFKPTEIPTTMMPSRSNLIPKNVKCPNNIVSDGYERVMGGSGKVLNTRS